MLAVLVSMGYYNKQHRLGGLNKLFISHSSEGWKVQDQGATDLVLGQSFLSGLQTAAHSLCPHMTERGSSGLSSFSYKGTNSSMRVPPLLLHPNLITPKDPLQYHHTGSVNWREDINFHFITLAKFTICEVEVYRGNDTLCKAQGEKTLKNLNI